MAPQLSQGSITVFYFRPRHLTGWWTRFRLWLGVRLFWLGDCALPIGAGIGLTPDEEDGFLDADEFVMNNDTSVN